MAHVVARSLINLQVEIVAGEHMLLADEPESNGGEDTGPNPYDLLLSAVVACKIITVQMYARRKQWPVESITMRANHSRVAAETCDDCSSPPGTKVDVIDCEIHFTGDLDEAQIARLTEIADRCPIHRTLTSETKVYTRLVEGDKVTR
jgi:putative redox protein